MNQKRRAALHNLGCKVNAYETEAMEAALIEAGYEIVGFDEIADLYVVNTCSVTNIADQKSRQMLHKAKKQNEAAIVCAVGCYVETAGEKILEDVAVDLVLGTNCKSQLVEKVDEILKLRETDSSQKLYITQTIDDKGCEFENMTKADPKEHTRAFLKVQDGCNQFCSYCVIPYARGRIRSRKIEDVIEEVNQLAKHGYAEVVLTGIHVTSYGVGEDYDLIDLIEAVNKIEGIKRIRLGSLEPTVMSEENVKRLANCEKLCPHFHLSLQSGCDATLERMNRHYDTKTFKAGVDLLRKYFDMPAITTDVICGFPGETDEEFEETYKFLEEINFYEMHVFPYSVRKGTRAEKMPNQVSKNIKQQRSKRLRDMTDAQSKEYRKAYEGKQSSVLLEEEITVDGVTYFSGYTPEYIRTFVVAKDVKPNDLIEGTLCWSKKLNGYILE